jgi:hypothetical protein
VKVLTDVELLKGVVTVRVCTVSIGAFIPTEGKERDDNEPDWVREVRPLLCDRFDLRLRLGMMMMKGN